MKLINYTLGFYATILFVTVSLWGVLFYSQLLWQVRSSIDEGLADYKIIIIDNLKNDSTIIQSSNFGKNKYIVKQIDENYALKITDTYRDTLIYSTLKQSKYRARLLTTAFLDENGRFYEMKVISQEINRGKLIRKFLFSLLGMLLFLLIGTALVNNFALKKTWKPFYRVLNLLNGFRLDQKLPDKNFPASQIHEFNLLNNSVKKLVNTNREIYESQKHFIENVSHEMQTPLAIGMNKLEMLVDSEELSEPQLQTIGDIIDTFKRLSGLNKSLLLLSKIKNKQFLSEENIDFDDVFIRTINNLTDYIDFWGINVAYNKSGNFVHKMNPDLAGILMMNLVKNAVTHNCQNGKIIIRMTSASFSIGNTGKKEAIPSDRIFQRFNKDAENKRSTGLGLAIVKAVTNASGLDINYSFNGKHIFSVTKTMN